MRIAPLPQGQPPHRRILGWTLSVAGLLAFVLAAVLLASSLRAARPVRAVFEPLELPPRADLQEPLVPLPPVPLPAEPMAAEQAARCAPEPPLPSRSAALPAAAELFRLAREEPAKLGSASIGSPTRGALWGGVQIPQSDGIQRAGDHGWGTETVVRSIERGVREVRRCYPGTPVLHVGDIARKGGGWLRPHRSHQSGLDADVGYYYRTGPAWFVQVTPDNLDATRTWALLRALIEGGNVEMIFIDRAVQRLLREHIMTLPEAERAALELFPTSENKASVIRHERGHNSHFHVRFSDPTAVQLGHRLPGVLPGLRAEAAAAKPVAAGTKSKLKPRTPKARPKPQPRRPAR